MAICHTVIIQKKAQKRLGATPRKANKGDDITDDENEEGKDIYSAQSPDELALINAAKYFGVKFMRRPTAKSILIQLDLGAIAGDSQRQFLQRSNTLKAPQRAESIEILNIIEFNIDDI